MVGYQDDVGYHDGFLSADVLVLGNTHILGCDGPELLRPFLIDGLEFTRLVDDNQDFSPRYKEAKKKK
ncbi:hypothetical protein FACS189472_14060 [Alphaproteobacteria bacterium]|nr:hypothetical protein FACS189472_14060 [Alphaproteobacteria bacterium]